MTELLPGSVCQTPTNDSCICTDASFAALVQPCILTKCTVTEGLSTQSNPLYRDPSSLPLCPNPGI